MSTPTNLSAAPQIVHPQLSEPLQGSQTILQGADENNVPQPLGQEQNDAVAKPLIIGAQDLEEKGKLIHAEKLYIMALQFTSKSEDYAHLPQLFEKKGEKKRAASSYVILADLQTTEGKQAETIATLKKSLELAPHPSIKEKLANLLNSHGQKQEAAILFLELAQQALYNKDNLSAMRFGRLALEAFPGHAEAWIVMASMQHESSETLKMLLKGANESSMPIKERMELCRMVSINEPEHLQAKLLFLELNQVKMRDKFKRLKHEMNERLSSLAVQAPPKAQHVAPVQAAIAPALPAWVCGAAEWKKYIGDPGVEPPLPLEIIQRLGELNANNVLVLIPETVDGLHLGLELMGELVQKPLQGHATKYRHFSLGEYVDRPAKSHWALLTRTVIEDSRSKFLKDERAVLKSYSKKTKIPYEAPTILDAAVCNFMEYVRFGTWLYPDGTYTWCQEKYNAKYQLIVGGGSAAGLFVNIACDGADEDFGVGGLKKF